MQLNESYSNLLLKNSSKPIIKKISGPSKRIIIINDNVFDVTGYFNSETKFFSNEVEMMFTDFNGLDATSAWSIIAKYDPKSSLYLQCLKSMFYIGQVDHRLDLKCQFSNYRYYIY